MKKIVKAAISILMIVGLVGCSGGGTSNKPTLANQKSDENAYENLMEMTVVAESTNKKGEEETGSFLFYVPKSKYADVYNNSAYSSENGVTLDVSINDYLFEEGEFADDVVKYMKEGILSDSYILKVVSESEIAVDEGRNNASYSALVIEENYDYMGEAIYNFFAAKELSPNQRIVVRISITASECNKLTDPMIKEIEEYYGIEIGFNLDEATKAQEEFNANPPETKRYDAFGFSFEIPFAYSIDYDMSDYTEDDFAFGPKGNANSYNNNLQVMVITSESTQYTSEELKADIEDLFTESGEDVAKVLDSDFISQDKAIIRCKLSGNSEYLDGYIVSYKNYVVYFATITDLTETDQQQLDVIHKAIDTFVVEY
ncbi:hypothetical protein [Anaerorhabdus sp.]|uniref:hypothetical protein n=1 Tax=Anaerorhabdus sp. TaxID=1872524 RepID=UPI002B1FD0E4|nr:hypothetical protein [Anaerorhabdus sp.]MEA4875895.1 hypothetical protein [Anaerorhabdus sp.]